MIKNRNILILLQIYTLEDILKGFDTMKMEYIFIKPADDYFTSKDMFRNFLSSNMRIMFKTDSEMNKEILMFDKKEFEYGLEYMEVEQSKETFFHLVVKIEEDEENDVIVLEAFDELIRKINAKCGEQFSINTLWNDVSMYYGKKLYPAISNVENTLRKIIYLFMLKTVGSKWLDISTPAKFRENIDEVIEKNQKEKSEAGIDWLIYADFITLGQFFAAPYSLKNDLKGLLKELQNFVYDEKLEGQQNREGRSIERTGHKKINLLTSETLKKLSDEYEAKNNWDRYFSDKLAVKSGKEFSKKWSALYNYRNAVAHGKIICRTDYNNAIKLTEMFEKMFEECIDVIDTLQINNEQAEAVEAVAQQVISKDSENVLARSRVLDNGIGTNDYMYRISMDPHTIENAVKNITGMSIAYSADEIKASVGQADSFVKMSSGIIPKSGMNETFVQDSVTNFLNGRIFIGESKQ